MSTVQQEAQRMEDEKNKLQMPHIPPFPVHPVEAMAQPKDPPPAAPAQDPVTGEPSTTHNPRLSIGGEEDAPMIISEPVPKAEPKVLGPAALTPAQAVKAGYAKPKKARLNSLRR